MISFFETEAIQNWIVNLDSSTTTGYIVPKPPVVHIDDGEVPGASGDTEEAAMEEAVINHHADGIWEAVLKYYFQAEIVWKETATRV